jgi:alpha-methylacyl-CoA racemase
MSEAARHPHNRARGTFVERDGVVQPAPAPRFSATPGRIGESPPAPGAHTRELLRDAGYTDATISALEAQKII